MDVGGKVLLADDEEKILKTLSRALRDEGHDVVTTADAHEAQKLLGTRSFDLAIVDLLMPERTGLEIIRELVATTPESERPAMVLMTAYGTIDSAVEALRLGARDYLQKPFDIEALLAIARRAVEDQRARTGLRYLMSERCAEWDDYGLAGKSPLIREVIDRMELVAQSMSTVLITGETGTGKELVARGIHARSAQSEMPLVKVNCAAIPDSLLESELFGHVRGAFTGATFTRKGRFALANGGSIFLDEIATLGPAIQAKLLRVLQEKEFEPLGAEKTQKVTLRVIAATNRDLRQLVREGRFQEDLYYRLNVIPIVMPPLRDRREDIPTLVDFFVKRSAERCGKRIEAVDPDAMEQLQRYDWPGNVRELENTIERAVVLARTPRLTCETVWLIGASSTPPATIPGINLHQNLEWTERETMRQALQQAGGLKKEAARLMGISQRALSHYLLKYRNHA